MLESILGGSGPDPAPEPASESVDVTVEEATSIVRNDRRREAIRFIAREGETDLHEVTDFLAALEADGAEPTASERKRVYIGLHQHHLAHLAEAAVIQFDSETKRITPGPRLEDFATVVERLETVCGGQQ